jgi:hypothetical protein
VRPLYEPIDDTISISNAPVRGADQLPAVLDLACAWAKERGRPMYCYQYLHGASLGSWTCGAYIPAGDIYIRVEPSGEYHLGCDNCDAEGSAHPDTPDSGNPAEMEGQAPRIYPGGSDPTSVPAGQPA